MIEKYPIAFNPEYVTHMYWRNGKNILETDPDKHDYLIVVFPYGEIGFQGKEAQEMWETILWETWRD